MAPRKRASSSSSKKSSLNNSSQPAKFGIQHFFDRHTQSTNSTPRNDPTIQDSQMPDANSSQFVSPSEGLQPMEVDAEKNPCAITPEITKRAVFKRFKVSPGMLIKQSQDDGGEDITWKISPMNERLQVVGKRLSDMTRVISDASKHNVSSLHTCSQKQSSRGFLKLENQPSFSPINGHEDPSFSETSSKTVNHAETDKVNTDAPKQSPFLTPPSLSLCHGQCAEDSLFPGALNQPDSRQYRKALIDLLDQVEDVISVDEALVTNMKAERTVNHEVSLSDTLESPQRKARLSVTFPKFLVLEVLEKHKDMDSSSEIYPCKVIRLLNEQTGEERALHLYHEWFYSPIEPGNTICVIGEADDQGVFVVDRDKSLLILHPDVFVSGTRVAGSFTCPRRAVLDERLKSIEHSSAALCGTLLHQIFQAGLFQEFPTREFLENHARTVLHKNVESLYACKANEGAICAQLLEKIPRILNWLARFKNSQVLDIEEMAWAPRYGLKGMIDASICVKVGSESSGSTIKIMPLELKTGKGTSGQSATEHIAQVVLYTLLMSDRYFKDIDCGLLYYLHTDETRGIEVRRSYLVGLIMRRNELASDLLKAVNLQLLPPMLQNPNICRSCRHLNICTMYHKAHGGTMEASGLGDAFELHVEHLTAKDSVFFNKWERLIDLEANESLGARKDTLNLKYVKGEVDNQNFLPLILDASGLSSSDVPSENGRFIYRFLIEDFACQSSKSHELELVDKPSKMNCTFKRGDCVMLSTKSGHVAIASGFITDIDSTCVLVSFSRRLRLPRSSSLTSRNDLTQEVWYIKKDEGSSAYSIMRLNLAKLFDKGESCARLRRLIVDLEAPRFDSGVIFSENPAISYLQSEKNLNDDQRRAVHKILTAKDYTLILGMPGTGKTSTMVHAVKALLLRGASILLTSYTNSAVDNLLLKLKAQGIDFVRIGRDDVVHEEIRSNCFSEMNVTSVEDIKHRMEVINVVGVTCLGIYHPLLARKKFDVCIMDEAGQITLPVSLGPLMHASTFVLVGDHYQLPPLVQSIEAQENGMAISLFRRLSEAHPQAISALQCQYRMCAGIMELSNALIYGNKLRCGASEVAKAKIKFSRELSGKPWLNEILDPERRVVFINTDMLPGLESRESNTVKNPTEAYVVMEVSKALVGGGIHGDDIGVITPYNSQVRLIENLVGSPSVEINTIDKYQGRDKDCIVVSFVRSSENPRACSSSLLGDWHRINVALTRAKKKLIMVGSCNTLSKIPLLKLLIEKVADQDGMVKLDKKDIHYLNEMKKCTQLNNIILS